MADNVVVTDEQLNKYYTDNAVQYTQTERRQASHILFAIASDATDDDKESVRLSAQSVLDQLHDGADFSVLAKEYSKDSGSAENGGDLGFFSKGEMVAAFEEIAFTMQPGEISGLVETPFGFHIIKLIAIEGGDIQPFDEVSDKINERLQFEMVENSYFEKTELIQTLAYEQPDSLDAIAVELNLTIKESELMTRKGLNNDLSGKMFSNPRLLETAFSVSVLEEGNNSDLIELDDDHVVVIRVVERIPANIRPIEDVRTGIETRLKATAIISKAQDRANELIQQLNAGQSLTDVVTSSTDSSQEALVIVETGLIERQDMKTPVSIIRKAFTMPRETKYASTKTADGDIAIIVINSIENGNSEDKEFYASVKSALLQNKGSINTALSVMQIRSETDVTINETLLNAEEQ